MKRFHLLTCLVALLSFAACTSELDTPEVTGEEVNVTFTAGLSDAVQTRAFSDGTSATDLFYSVFIDGTPVAALRGANLKFDNDATVWTVPLNLIRGVKYDIVFWAQAKTAPYKFDPATGTVTYAENAVLYSNDNTMDAFYHKETITVTGPLVKGDIVLKRALAQINVGTNDLAEAKKLGLSDAGAESSSMVVEGASKGFDLLKETALNETADLTFGDAKLTNFEDETFNISDDASGVYEYLVRNYVFARANVDVSFNVKYNNGAKSLSYDVTSVPVKTNYRTNIYGQLFTNPLSVNVSIDNKFAENNTAEHPVNLLEAKTMDELATLLAQDPDKDKNIKYTGEAPTGDTEIDIPKGVTGNVALDLPAIEKGENGETYAYTIKASETATESPKKIDVTVPTDSNGDKKNDVVVDAPHATVTVNGVFVNATATTANDTFIVASGSTIEKLTVLKGNVRLEGTAVLKEIVNSSNQTIYLTATSDATLPTTIPDNVVVTMLEDVQKDADGNLEILTANGLRWLADDVNSGNSYKGKTIKLVSDIDLANSEWTPIGQSGKTFQGKFDGQNHTVKNLKITGNKSYVGLFGYTTNGEIKNLTVENAEVSGYIGVAVVAGCPYTSKYNNITVKGLVKINGMSYVGAVGGRNAYASWSDITVDVEEESFVNANSVENGTAYRTYIGGVVGFMGEGRITMQNVSSNINVIGSTVDAGGVVGIAHYNNTFINCHSSGNVTITDASEDDDEIGGVAGVWMNSSAGPVTFTNCSFTGKLSINNKTDLSDKTIVGPPYHKDNATGKLIIDGKEYNGLFEEIQNVEE